MINYQEIIENLSTERVKGILDNLKIPYQDKGNYLLCKTACHNTDVDSAHWKLYYYENTHMFYCYTSCGAMSIFKFLKYYYQERQIDYDWYEDIYKVILGASTFSDEFSSSLRYSSKRDKYVKSSVKELPEYSKGVLDCFIKKYPTEWLNDGISKEAMDKYNILFSISQNKIIIPHYDVKNRLIGIRGRALSEWEIENLGKYMPVKIEQTWYNHPLSLNLYGLNFNKENIKKTGICYICESEKAVLQAESFSMKNCCVAICGSNFNKYQLKILLKECHPREIVLCLDNEELPGEDLYFNKLYKICEKYKNYCNFSFVYDRKHLTKQKDSPTDCGEEVFRRLLKERVRVK